jgi:PAS domain S-box-containing protein
MQMTPSTGLSVVATLVSLGVAAFTWQRRATPGARSILAFTLGTAVWTSGNAFQAASTTLLDKLFWVNVQYIGIALVPVAWFAFACKYTDRGWADRRTLAFLGAPMLVIVLLAWTNGSHHLVRASSDVVTRQGNAVLERTFGPAFWAGWVYSNLLTGTGTVLLLYNLLRVRKIFLRQTVAVLAGTTVPWVASGLFYTELISLEPEVFFAVSGIAFAYAIAEYDLFEVVPVGRNVVVEQMDDGVLVLDGDDRLVDANPAAAETFGWSDVESVIGQPLAEVDVPHAQLLGDSGSDRAAGLSEDDRATDRLDADDEDGTTRYVDVRRTSLSDARDGATGTLLILRDVTELKRRETRLQRKNERLERVGQTIAHDLRNPLNVAKGRLELAAETGDDEHLREVGDAHERMSEIIDEILDMARGDRTDDHDRVGLREVAETAWRNVETGEVGLEFEADGGSVLADESELTSAFENLFRNSLEHGGDGVTIRVGELDGEAGFYVEDDGRGISKDQREAVFEAGYTTRDAGNGVGLAVVDDVAERHGWTVEVTESDEGGARFEFRNVETAPTSAPAP